MPQEFDPQKEMNDETLRELENYLKLPLENKTPNNHIYDRGCEHKKVYLDDEDKSVTCQDCKKKLDPYWYLNLLAQEWKRRRYQDAEAIKAYRLLKQEELNKNVSGKIYVKPTEGEGLVVWETYEALTGHPPEYIFRIRHHGWHVGENDGWQSFDFMRAKLSLQSNTYKINKDKFIEETERQYKITGYLISHIYDTGFKDGRTYQINEEKGING